MTDDLVKRARHNAQSDMPHYASVALIEEMAARIEELEDALQSILMIPNSPSAQGIMKVFAGSALMGEDNEQSVTAPIHK